MNKKILKEIKILLILFVCISIVVSLIISKDEHHLEICKDEKCIYCIIILIAQNIINLVINFIETVILGFLIYFFLSRLYKEKIIFLQLSLVFQKVQLNE